MTTALVLCQNVARRSGMFSGTVPAAFTGQSGDLLKVVDAVVNAYIDLQNSRPNWRWLETEFTKTTSQDVARYTGSGWGLTRWADWLHDTTRRRPYSMYLTATGVSDENEITGIVWESYVRLYVRGTQTSNRPTHYAISPAGEFCLGPVPDADYTIRGSYRKGPQTLSSGSEEPEMPSRFHRLIELLAEMDLHKQEEGWRQAASTQNDARMLRRDLERDQLPLRDLGGGWAALA
ncbi:MAG: hypothetical protein FJX55_03585 [Alphaproteobacteria bacterium]|nr:hypothetical protein [Alphaproteobacteria bacterium]